MAASAGLILQSGLTDDTSLTPDLGKLLKHLYADWEIEDLLNTSAPLYAKIARRGSAKLGGNGFYFPVRLSNAAGHAFIADNGTLPLGGSTEVRQAVIQPKVQAGVIELTGLARAISSGDAMAFASAYDENVTNTMAEMMAYREGALFRDGTATLGSIPAGGLAGIASGQVIVSDVGYFREGMFIEVVSSTYAARHEFTGGAIVQPSTINAYKVVAVDWTTPGSGAGTITLNGVTAANTVVVTDLIVAAGVYPAAPAAALFRELDGLASSVADTPTNTYLGLNRSTASNANWKNSALNVSGFLDEDALLRARTRIHQETGVKVQAMSRDFGVVTHPMQVDNLFKLAIPKIRYAGNDRFDFGYDDTVYFGNIPFWTSHQCPTSKAYMGDWSYHCELVTPNGELGVDSELNGTPLKWVDRQDACLVLVKGYSNLALRNPTRFCVMHTLSEASR